MNELKVGDVVHSTSMGFGKVVGVLTQTPPSFNGPVAIVTDTDSRLVYRNIYGVNARLGGPLPLDGRNDFVKVKRKKKVKMFLNIYDETPPFVYAHATELGAKRSGADRGVAGLAVPFEYEYEVED
jgi:hypothetical protein